MDCVKKRAFARAGRPVDVHQALFVGLARDGVTHEPVQILPHGNIVADPLRDHLLPQWRFCPRLEHAVQAVGLTLAVVVGDNVAGAHVNHAVQEIQVMRNLNKFCHVNVDVRLQQIYHGFDVRRRRECRFGQLLVLGFDPFARAGHELGRDKSHDAWLVLSPVGAAPHHPTSAGCVQDGAVGLGHAPHAVSEIIVLTQRCDEHLRVRHGVSPCSKASATRPCERIPARGDNARAGSRLRCGRPGR